MTTCCPSRLAAALALVGLLFAGRPASGQSVPDQLDLAAQQHLDLATAAYAARDYDRVLAELRAAYAIDPRPSLVYAQAQAQRMAGRCADAIETYRAFLALRPPPIEAGRAERHIARCGEVLRAERRPTQPRTRLRAPRGRSFTQDGWGLLLTSVGIASLGTGIGFFVAAASSEDSAEQATDYPSFRDSADAFESRRLVGTIALAAGGALVALGVLRLVLWTQGGRTEPTRRATSLQGSGIELFF